jgi:hypothetical protein
MSIISTKETRCTFGWQSCQRTRILIVQRRCIGWWRRNCSIETRLRVRITLLGVKLQ